MMCGTANRPIIATTRLMPCWKVTVPKVSRWAPVMSSRPMVISMRPSTPAISPRVSDFSASPQMVDMPNTTKAKISAGPNLSARRDSRLTDTTMMNRLISPPTVELITASPSARLALPDCRIG